MKWQIGIRAMLLLTAAFAVWFSHLQSRAEIARLGPRVASLRSIARELVVDDENKIVVVMKGELWTDDNRWEIYLPTGDYRLNLATREIGDKGLAPPLKSVAIPAGKHELALEQKRDGETWRVTATLDDKTAIEAEEPRAWNSGRGSSGRGGFTTSTQFDRDKPVILHHRRFTSPDALGQFRTPDGPSEGILMWIERVR